MFRFKDYIKKTCSIPFRKMLLACFLCILTISCGVSALIITQSQESIELENTKTPLLLNSGIVDTRVAEANVIIWLEDRKVPHGLWNNKPTENWEWNYKELQMENGKVARTLTGQDIISKNEEINLFAWYTNMVPMIEKAGGKIYLDERTSEAIDISAYLSQTNAEPTQWVLADNLMSSAAYQKNIDTSVLAGSDQINIQLLSRGKGTDGHSVLAIPVLLKEF